MSGSALVDEAVKINVFHSMQELFNRSEIIRARARSGKLKVVGMVYDIKSGRVDWLGTHPNQNELLSARRHKQAKSALHRHR